MNAWGHLQNAVFTLTGEGTLRERMVRCCLTHLVNVKLKDLPREVHAPFMKLTGLIFMQGNQRSANVIAALSDSEVRRLAVAIVEMYDSIARYEPRPAIGKALAHN